MKTKVNLRVATVHDLFNTFGVLKENKKYFMLKNVMEGPFTVFDDEINRTEMFCRISYLPQVVYVIDQNSKGIEFELELRCADAADIKTSRTRMKNNTEYFILSNNIFLGPFEIQNNTNVKDIQNYLSTQSLWILK